MERVVIAARLSPRAEERAAELLRKGPPFDPKEYGFDRHSAYLGPEEVVFVFEGVGADAAVRSLVNDQVVSASFAAWAPLIEGTPRVLPELFFWQAPTRSRPGAPARGRAERAPHASRAGASA